VKALFLALAFVTLVLSTISLINYEEPSPTKVIKPTQVIETSVFKQPVIKSTPDPIPNTMPADTSWIVISNTRNIAIKSVVYLDKSEQIHRLIGDAKKSFTDFSGYNCRPDAKLKIFIINESDIKHYLLAYVFVQIYLNKPQI